MEGRPEGKLWEQARCEEEAAGPQLPGKSSWMIPGVGQTGNVVLEAAVARLCEEHSPTGGASSWKSTGTDRSQPSLLRDEPWHQVQTRIFPSPVSAAAQTADGIAQTLPSPFSPAIATLCSQITPENTLEPGPPSAASMGVTPPTAGSPQPRTLQPSGHSSRGGCKPRPVVPQLGMQSRCAEAFPCTGLFGNNG